MFKSEIDLLKAENKEQFESLEEVDQDIIKKIMRNINIYRVNSYDTQVIKRDLIGMAQEASLRGSDLSSIIGDDVKGFTNDIVENSNGKDRTELVLEFLILCTKNFFIIYGVLTLFTTKNFILEANFISYVFIAATTILGFLITAFLEPYFSIEDGAKKYIPRVVSLAILLIILAIAMKLKNVTSYTINSAYIVFPSVILYLIFNYCKVKNISKLSKNRENYVEDIIKNR